MSDRYNKEDKKHKGGRDRSRSRSPKDRNNDHSKRKQKDYDKRDYNYKKDQKESDNKLDDNHKKLPESYSLILPSKVKMPSIQMKIGGSSNKPKLSTASAFNEDSDEEPEEMPPEARMRMKNIGRNTPTSSGPNSFGKTKQGFSDAKKIFERNLKEAMDAARADD